MGFIALLINSIILWGGILLCALLMGRTPKGYNRGWAIGRLVILAVGALIGSAELALLSVICAGVVIVNFMISMTYVNTKGTLHTHMNKAMSQHIILSGLITFMLFKTRYSMQDVEGAANWAKLIVPIVIACATIGGLYYIISKKPADDEIRQGNKLDKMRRNTAYKKEKAELALEEADAARTQAQASMTKAAVKSVGRGAVAGATISGTLSGAKIGSNAASTENLLMQTDHISRVNEKLANSNITEEQAKYIQEQTLKGHEIGSAVNDKFVEESAKLATDAIKVGFDVVRKKAADFGMKTEGKSDEDLATEIISNASEDQIAALPEGLSDAEKASVLMGCG